MRRTVKNDGDVPVNYGLRRVLRQVRVKLQSLGPRLVWTLYVNRPGGQLAGIAVTARYLSDASSAHEQAPNDRSPASSRSRASGCDN